MHAGDGGEVGFASACGADAEGEGVVANGFDIAFLAKGFGADGFAFAGFGDAVLAHGRELVFLVGIEGVTGGQDVDRGDGFSSFPEVAQGGDEALGEGDLVFGAVEVEVLAAQYEDCSRLLVQELEIGFLLSGKGDRAFDAGQFHHGQVSHVGGCRREAG